MASCSEVVDNCWAALATLVQHLVERIQLLGDGIAIGRDALHLALAVADMKHLEGSPSNLIHEIDRIVGKDGLLPIPAHDTFDHIVDCIQPVFSPRMTETRSKKKKTTKPKARRVAILSCPNMMISPKSNRRFWRVATETQADGAGSGSGTLKGAYRQAENN
jgi:hypothetical protein